MKKMEFDPGKVLGKEITALNRQELCELAAKLCGQIKAEAGTRDYRGGIYPENISIDDNGGVSIGLAKQSGWAGQELQFLPPELYWNGKRGSFSDVYSLGLLLYYAVSKGRLPYEGECQDPQLRRMGGENFPAPRAAGRRLGEIIEKATRFNAEERYKNVEELQIMLESLVKNLYLNGTPSAEAIFKKNDDDLTELERIMVGIIEQGEGEPAVEEEPEAEAAAPVLVLPDEAAPAAAKAAPEEGVKVYEPAQRRSPPAASAPAGAPRARQPIPVLTEEKNPELEPVVLRRQQPITPAVQYGKSAQRERKIAEEVKKRKRRPVVVILVLCAALIVAAILGNALLRDLAWDKGKGPDPSELSPSPDVGGAIIGDAAAPTAPAQEAEPEKTASTYEIFREDLSWTEARDRCIALGGHLAVIRDQEEYNTVVALAEERGVNRLWVGLHRENGQNVWETDETVNFYPWDVEAGEPSFTDSYDNVAEDYVMLWYNNGGWYYNDSRNNPVADYPQWYSGTIGFICEYEQPAG